MRPADAFCRGRRRFPRWGFLLLVLLLIGLVACQVGAPAIDHYALAQGLQAQIKAEGKDGQFTHPLYEQLAQELQLVPSSAPHYDDAQAELMSLNAARRSMLWRQEERDGGSYSKEYKVAEGGTERHDPSTGSYVGGVWLPYQNVNVSAIAAGTKANAQSTSGSSARNQPSAGAQASGGAPSVTIYTASWCGVCKAAKAYMAQKGISYTERDIEKDPAARAAVLARTGSASSIPVIDVNGKIMVGFDQNAFDKLIRQSGS